MNNDILAGKWKEIKGDIQAAWGKLTDDELEKSEGDSTKLSGLIQNRYGMAKEDASTKLTEIFKKYTTPDEKIGKY